MSDLDEVMRGALAVGFAVAGLFFLRFWRESRDRLFAFFAIAFFTLAVNRVWLALESEHVAGGGDRHYWIRFVAFLMILFAILDKNRAKPVAGG